MRAQPTASHFIAGSPMESPKGKSFPSIYPATGETIAELHAADAETIDKAVSGAREGQKVWAALNGAERPALCAQSARG